MNQVVKLAVMIPIKQIALVSLCFLLLRVTLIAQLYIFHNNNMLKIFICLLLISICFAMGTSSCGEGICRKGISSMDCFANCNTYCTCTGGNPPQFPYSAYNPDGSCMDPETAFNNAPENLRNGYMNQAKAICQAQGKCSKCFPAPAPVPPKNNGSGSSSSGSNTIRVVRR